MQKTTILNEVLDGLMSRYKERVPDVAEVIAAMIQEGVINNGKYYAGFSF